MAWSRRLTIRIKNWWKARIYAGRSLRSRLLPKVKNGSRIQGDKSQVKGQAEGLKSKQTRSGAGANTQNTGANQEIKIAWT